MTTPNRFKRNSSFLILSSYDPDTDIDSVIGSLPNGQWFIDGIEWFTNSNEDLDARITISSGNISKFTFTATKVAIYVNGDFITTNANEILDFFMLP